MAAISLDLSVARCNEGPLMAETNGSNRPFADMA
jgi:hypothetical protein